MKGYLRDLNSLASRRLKTATEFARFSVKQILCWYLRWWISGQQKLNAELLIQVLYFAFNFAEFPNERMLEVSVQLVGVLFSIVDTTSLRYQIECFQICSRRLETASKHQSKFSRNHLRQKLFSSLLIIIFEALQLSNNASESSSYQSYIVPAGRLSKVALLACSNQHSSDEGGDVDEFYSSAVTSLKGKRTAQSSEKFKVYGQFVAHDLSRVELKSAICFVFAEPHSSEKLYGERLLRVSRQTSSPAVYHKEREKVSRWRRLKTRFAFLFGRSRSSPSKMDSFDTKSLD